MHPSVLNVSNALRAHDVAGEVRELARHHSPS